jgi:hypothetical protein
MRKVGRTIQRIDVPAELALQGLPRTLFAIDAVVRQRRTQTGDDQRFTGAVGLGNQVDVAFILRRNAAMIKLAQ